MKSLIVFLLLFQSTLYGQSIPQVVTEEGIVSGVETDVRVFRGIPYASAPVGESRWKPPQPPAHWTGTRAAAAFGNPCIQPATGIPLPQQSEDCLTLNIWAPKAATKAKLPVLVCIHGGGFLAGSSSLPAYVGEGWARQGIVFVSLNYRLGVMGFLAHPGLSRESPHGSSGNYGLLDQIQALLWIRRNIAAFGGNPGRVTVFGESSGGSSVGFLLVSPLARGLFQQAISESPQGLFLPISHRDQPWYGRVSGEQLGERIGPQLKELRALSPGDLLKKSSPANPDLPKGSEFQPIVDGWVLPDDPAVLYASGKAQPVALLAGTNSNDGAALTFLMRPAPGVPGYRAYLNRRFGDAAEQASELYLVHGDADARASEDLIATDMNFLYGTSSMVLAISRKNKNVYWYEFTRRDPLSRSMGITGAFHGAEMGYVNGDFSKMLFSGPPFVTRPLDYDEKERVLLRAMNGAWVRFTKQGNPNGKGLPHWPRVSPDNPQYLEFGENIQVGRGLREKQMQFIADLMIRQRPKQGTVK